MTDPSVNEIEVARKQLAAIAKQITDIKRRDTEQVGPDGYRTGSGNGRMSKGTHSDPTEAAAGAHKEHDHVHEHTVKLLSCVKTACDAANRAAGYLAALTALVDERTGRRNLVDCCPVCDDPMPQPRAGMCEPDYRRWTRAGRPERAPWINQERRRLADMREDVA